MGRFSVSQLAGEDKLGATLRLAREAKGLRAAEVSRRLKLPLRYLESIEAGRWHELPEGTYARLFVRTYATFLGLKGDELLSQHPVPARAAPIGAVPQPARVRRVAYGRRTILIVGACITVVYLASQAWQALERPQLQLASPADNLTTFTPMTMVSGLASAGAQVTVNGEKVDVSADGKFVVEVALAPGLNTITVVTQKAYAKPVMVVRRVLFAPPAAPGDGGGSLIP